MATDLTIKPAINSTGNVVAVQYGSALALQKVLIDRTSPLQAILGVYNYMALNTKAKYDITTIDVGGLVLKADSCNMTDGGAITSTNREVEPCDAAMAEDVCSTTLMSAAFESARPYLDGDGTAWASFEEVMTRIATQAISVSSKSLMALAIGGGSYGNAGTGDFAYNTGKGAITNRRAAYVAQKGLCDGLLVKLAAASGVTVSPTTMTEANGAFVDGNFTGSAYNADAVLPYYDYLAANCTDTLKVFVETGATVTSDGVERYPILWCDPKFHNAVSRAFFAQNADAAKNGPRGGGRITTKEIPSGDPMKIGRLVYMIDNTYVIPVSEQSVFEEVLTGWYSFAYLTVTGVLNVGMNFSSFPFQAFDGTNTGVTRAAIDIQDMGQTNNKQKGLYSLTGKFLVAADISDTNLVYGSQAYLIPA